MDKKGGVGGVSRITVKNDLSHSDERNCRGIFKCVTDFGYRKILCIKGVCYDILSKTFCLTVPKKIVRKSLGVSLISAIEEFCALER